jgi:hypothetical protein
MENYEGFHLFGYNAMQSAVCQPTFRERLDLYFAPEDECNMFFRNIGLL